MEKSYQVLFFFLVSMVGAGCSTGSYGGRPTLAFAPREAVRLVYDENPDSELAFDVAQVRYYATSCASNIPSAFQGIRFSRMDGSRTGSTPKGATHLLFENADGARLMVSGCHAGGSEIVPITGSYLVGAMPDDLMAVHYLQCYNNGRCRLLKRVGFRAGQGGVAEHSAGTWVGPP